MPRVLERGKKECSVIGRSRDASAPPFGAESAWTGLSPNPRGSSARGRITGPIGVLSAWAASVWVAIPETACALSAPAHQTTTEGGRKTCPGRAPALKENSNP